MVRSQPSGFVKREKKRERREEKVQNTEVFRGVDLGFACSLLLDVLKVQVSNKLGSAQAVLLQL